MKTLSTPSTACIKAWLWRKFASVAIAFCSLTSAFADFDADLDYRPFLPRDPLDTNPYGLPALGNGGAGNFLHCRWGVYQDEGTLVGNQSTVTLSYSESIQNPTDELFVSTDLFSIDHEHWLYEIGAAANPNTHTVTLIAEDQRIYYLFRKLHFKIKGALIDEMTGHLLDENAEKVIILIHGWNRNNDHNAYDQYEGGEWKYNDEIAFYRLFNTLKAELAGKGWSLGRIDIHASHKSAAARHMNARKCESLRS
jgi:hypothetical protein